MYRTNLKQFRNKRKLKRRLYSKPVILLLIIILALIARGTFKVYQRSKISEENLALTAGKYEELKEREDKIGKQVEYFGSSFGVEKEIRSKYDVSKEGEKLVVIVENDPPVAVPEEPSALRKLLNTVKSWFGDE